MARDVLFHDAPLPEVRDVPGRPFREFRFPDGYRCFGLTSPGDIALRYSDIVANRRFFPEGVTPVPGEIVVDAGGGLGLFADAAAREWPEVAIHSFEPIPEEAAIFRDSLGRRLGAPEAHRIVLHEYGLGEGRYDQADIAFYPEWTGFSTRFPELKDRLREVFRDVVSPETLDEIFDFRIFPVPLRTLSSVLDELGRPAVGLLKIDVEGDERAVILGIEKDHWTMVRSVAITVHDIAGEGEAIRDILRERAPHLDFTFNDPDLRGRVFVYGKPAAGYG